MTVAAQVQTPHVALTPAEAAFLASLLGADALLGVTDPLAGMLSEEITKVWAEARDDLERRGYIREEPGGKLTIDTQVAALTGTWSAPESAIMVSYAPSVGKPIQLNYFLTTYLAVGQYSADGMYRLEPVNEADIHRQITALFRVKAQAASPGTSLSLPLAQFSKAREIALQEGAEAAQQVLTRADRNPDAVEALAQSLASTKASGSVTGMARQATTWEIAGMGLLEGSNGLWRLRTFSRGNDNWVEAIPCDAATMGAEIGKLVSRVLPEHGNQ